MPRTSLPLNRIQVTHRKLAMRFLIGPNSGRQLLHQLSDNYAEIFPAQTLIFIRIDNPIRMSGEKIQM